MRFFGGFLFGLVTGYCIVLFGWVGYTNVVSVNDFKALRRWRSRLLCADWWLTRRPIAWHMVADAQTLDLRFKVGHQTSVARSCH